MKHKLKTTNYKYHSNLTITRSIIGKIVTFLFENIKIKPGFKLEHDSLNQIIFTTLQNLLNVQNF